MRNFLLHNKLAILLFLLFLSVALISGIYSNKIRTKDNTDLEMGNVSEQQGVIGGQSPQMTVTNTEQAVVRQEVKQTNTDRIAEQTPEQSAEPVKADAALKAEENQTAVATSTPSAIVGEKHSLKVGDKEYDTTLPVNSTVYELMLTLKQDGQLDFKGKDSAGLGFFVEEINGLKNDPANNTYWIYYVNGRAGQIGISFYHLKANDIISWKYEKSPF